MSGVVHPCSYSRGGGGNRDAAAAAFNPQGEEVPVECLICADSCRALCVFPCGHFTCYGCGLRIHSINKGSCPVCREASTMMPIITQRVSREEEQFSAEEMNSMRQFATKDTRLMCVIDSPPLACIIAKLYEFTCPIEACWCRGFQDPFLQIKMLKDHLRVDHQLAYCEVCLRYRPAFLCEQAAYSNTALQNHMNGRCRHDRSSFTGHPPCRFCKRDNLFYDGESLLKHMQQQHYTCDVCNRGQFTFTYYATRQKLDQHFETCHKICDHPDCASLDLMTRVFGNEIDLMVHKQRVHGVKAKVTFSPGMFGEASSFSGGSGPAGTAPATASNTNVIQITFDHVFRVETVDMMPSRANNQRGGRRGGAGGNAVDIAYVPEESGIPPHYVSGIFFPHLTRTVTRSSDALSSSARPGGWHGNQRGGDPSFPGAPGSGNRRACNMKHIVPADKKQLEERLNDMLNRQLRSPIAYANFRRYTREFVESTMLTSEYYDLLAKECFPDPWVFGEVFPLIVATMPVGVKQSALQEVYKMRTAPETQRIARAREEDARKAAEAEASAGRAEGAHKRSTGNNTQSNNGDSSKAAPAGAPSPFGRKKGKGGKQNVWLTTDAVSKLGGNTPASAQHHDPSADSYTPPARASGSSGAAALKSQSKENSSAWASTSPGLSGPPAATHTSFPVQPSHTPHVGRGLVINEETFPSLPSNGIRRDPIGKANRPKSNAWFKR